MLLTLMAAGILLADLILLTALVVLILEKAEISVPGSRKALDFFTGFYREIGLVFSISAVSGSLYISKILNYTPCELCWYQRILIFPIPSLLGVSIFLKKEGVSDYILPFMALGLPISAYHYLVQMTSASTRCSTAVSCDTVQIKEFGFVTVPWMSLTFFLVTGLLMLLGYRNDKNRYE